MKNSTANILIVDDNVDNLNVLAGMLAEQNYKVRRAINGSIALRAIKASIPDLILLDIVLPDMTGYDICTQLKQHPSTQDIPVIFISSLNDAEDKVKAFAVGGVDYVSKPFEMAEVCARIRNQLEIQFAKAEIESLNAELEQRVQERTAELTAVTVTLEKQIQERQKAEQALRHSESRFRAMIENASDLILLLDPQGIVHYSSPSVERNLGYLPTDLQGQSLVHLLHPQDQSNITQLLAEVLATPSKVAVPLEIRWQHQAGHWCTLEAMAQQFADTSGFSGIVVNARDITERQKMEAMQRALEQEQELSELKLRFFSMASHEFRTPLSVILMAAQILGSSESQSLDSKHQRNIERIHTSAQYLEKMLADILDIARLEAQKREFNPRPVCVKTMCDRILDTQQTSHGGISRIRCAYTGLSAEIALDPDLFQSILNNLLANALKYSAPEKLVQVKLTQELDQIELMIIDQGIGIPKASQSQLFEAFHRGNNVGEIEGSGLGLAIVKKCVDLHGGHLSFVSEASGTAFTVRLPIQTNRHQADPLIRQTVA
ncbi:response regulator [Acaryochloris sp. CCMEE 5410]|uniref:response regulator n=1 Tax=Acaryochloris sp. CCMEE 5410 TaxID=310037 RepID=UPI0021D0AC5C|nr:response regulator [Acaryochloris sp. CCMEE 5410]KAI9131279.1 response regulator [Acaryochloris sp. CCMEE 5410]